MLFAQVPAISRYFVQRQTSSEWDTLLNASLDALAADEIPDIGSLFESAEPAARERSGGWSKSCFAYNALACLP